MRVQYINQCLSARKGNVFYSNIYFAICIGIGNVISCFNFSFAIVLILFEVVILFYDFMKFNLSRYVCHLVLFIAMSVEFSTIAGTDSFYNIKNIRILGVNIGVWCMIPAFMLIIFDIIRRGRNKKSRHQRIIGNSLFYLKATAIICGISIVMGVICILINDNDIRAMQNVLGKFVEQIYQEIFITLGVSIIIIYTLAYFDRAKREFECTIISILVAISISSLFSILTKQYGRHGDSYTLLVSGNCMFLPLMLTFPFYKRKYEISAWFIAVIGGIGTVLSLLYNASGKMVIIMLFVPVIVILNGNNGGVNKSVLRFSLFSCMFLILVVFLFSNSNSLFQYKLEQALSLLQFWKEDWLINMPSSPRWRLLETYNITVEYLKKPWFSIFGKGLMGTIKDYSGMYTYGTSAYPAAQWSIGSFFSVHETLNRLFLIGGINGIIFIVSMVKRYLKSRKNNPYITIGFIWFIFCWGYSITWAVFGIMSLSLGMSLFDESNHLTHLVKIQKEEA